MEIAIIDDGVSGLHFPDLAFEMKVVEGRVVPVNDKTERWEHGSTCAAIIRKYAPEARLGSIQILDKTTERGNIADFLTALQWCVAREIKLVHASLGSIASEDYEPLCKAVAEARRRGVILVAACKNGLRCAYPASLEDVIGVKTDEDLCEDAYRANSDVAADGIEFIASSRHTLPYKRWEGEAEWVTALSNSYAAPLITAGVHHSLAAHPKLRLEEIKAALGASRGRAWWESVPASPEAERAIPMIWMDEGTPASLCDKLVERFHRERYTPLVLSWEEDAPDFLRKAAALAELRHMDLVIVCAAIEKLRGDDAILPDIVISRRDDGDTRLLKRMREEENLWLWTADKKPKEIVDEVLYTLL